LTTREINPAMKASRSRRLPGAALAGALACTAGAHAAEPAAAAALENQAELAKKLANPVASLISVPLQYNYDENIGPNEQGSKSLLNVQPVIPLSLGQDWNLIIRTIVPLIDQQDVSARGQGESGLGDITQSFFFSPKTPVGGWILAAGPVGYYRSATDQYLGAEKWGAGPTALALRQTGPWTVGLLTNHIESFAGDSDRAEMRDVRAALPVVHHEDQDDVFAELGIHLRLGERPMVGAGQCDGGPVAEDRSADPAGAARRALLGRVTRQWRGGLGATCRCHAAVSEIARKLTALDASNCKFPARRKRVRASSCPLPPLPRRLSAPVPESAGERTRLRVMQARRDLADRHPGLFQQLARQFEADVFQ